MKLFKLITLSLLVTLTSFQTIASDSDWDKIAEKAVSFKSETDSVNPLSPFANARFSHIKIKMYARYGEFKKRQSNHERWQRENIRQLGRSYKWHVFTQSKSAN